MTHKEVIGTLALNLEVGRRKGKKDGIQGFLAGTGAGASGSLACSVVFSSLLQEPRHCVSGVSSSMEAVAGCQEEALGAKP